MTGRNHHSRDGELLAPNAGVQPAEVPPASLLASPLPLPLPLPLSVAGYYRAQPEPHRATLLQLRVLVLRVIPGAQEVIKYAMPTFVVDDKPVCGLMAHREHIGFYPYSGSVLERVPDIVTVFGGTKSALHLPIDQPVSIAVIRAVIEAKLDSMGA